MIDLFKAYGKYAFTGLVVLILGLLIVERSCKDPYESKEYLKLKGQFTEYKATVEEAEEKRAEEEVASESKVRALLEENEKLEKEKDKILEGSMELNEEIEKNQEELRILREEEETIENVKAQNIILEANFNKAIADRDEERAARLKSDKQNENFKLSLKEKDKTIAGLHTSLDNERALRIKCEGLVEEGEKGRTWQKIELVVTRGFAVYGILSAGKAVFK